MAKRTGTGADMVEGPANSNSPRRLAKEGELQALQERFDLLLRWFSLLASLSRRVGGLSGTGKSRLAAALASRWGLPLY